MYSEKYDITGIFAVSEKFVLEFEEESQIPVKIYVNRAGKHVMTLDFEKFSDKI